MAFWDQYGGKEAYIKSQQERYKQAVASGDTDLINRLKADAARVGYSLPSVSAPKSTSSSSDYWSRYTGGKEGYIKSQQERYRQAVSSGDTDLINRLKADAARVGYSLPSVSTNTMQQATTQYIPAQQTGRTATQNVQDILKSFSKELQQYLFPYEQAMRDVLASAPRYTPPSESELAQQARQWAELQINPQIQALQRAVEQARQAYEAQRQATESAYAGFEEQTSRMLQEAAQRALESAIARGGGRSGQVEWFTAQLQQPIAERAAQVQAERAARLADVANRLSLVEQQAREQEQQLQERLGQLEASRLAELRELAHATAVGDWQRVMQATQNLAALATQAQQFAQNYAASLLPYFALTEAQRQAQPLDWAQVMGEVPAAPQPQATFSGAVPLRSYATARGAGIDYDPATGTVIINGRRYSASALQGMGGYLQNGSWYLPASVVDALIGGY
jgi:hypothetical protein